MIFQAQIPQTSGDRKKNIFQTQNPCLKGITDESQLDCPEITTELARTNLANIFPPESTPGRLSPSDPWMVPPAFRPPWRLRLPNYPSCKCLFFETLRPVWRPKLTKVRCNSTYVAGGLVNCQLRKLVHFERSSRDEFSSRVACARQIPSVTRPHVL